MILKNAGADTWQMQSRVSPQFQNPKKMPHFLGMLGERWWQQFGQQQKYLKLCLQLWDVNYFGASVLSSFGSNKNTFKCVFNCIGPKMKISCDRIITVCSHWQKERKFRGEMLDEKYLRAVYRVFPLTKKREDLWKNCGLKNIRGQDAHH